MRSSDFIWCLTLSLSFSAAVIKIEGGTDFDLQVLEAPTAPLAAGGEASSSSSSGGGGGGGGGEKSQGGPSGGNVSGQTGGSDSTGSRTEGTTSGETGETKDCDKVRAMISEIFCGL